MDQTWGESTFNDSESDSGRLFDSESDSSQFGCDSESDSDSSNISISDSDSESDSNFQLLIYMKLLLGNFVPSASHTELLKYSNPNVIGYWFVPSHTKLLKLRAQTGSKPHKQRFLCDMSPVPVITATRLVDLLNQAIHTAG